MVTPELGRGRCSHLLLPSCLLCLNELLLVSAQSCPTVLRPHGLAHQAPLFVGFSRQEYLSISFFPFFLQEFLPFPSPGDPALAGRFLTV